MPNSLVKNLALLLEMLPSAKYRQTADFTDRLIPKISNAPAWSIPEYSRLQTGEFDTCWDRTSSAGLGRSSATDLQLSYHIEVRWVRQDKLNHILTNLLSQQDELRRVRSPYTTNVITLSHIAATRQPGEKTSLHQTWTWSQSGANIKSSDYSIRFIRQVWLVSECWRVITCDR